MRKKGSSKNKKYGLIIIPIVIIIGIAIAISSQNNVDTPTSKLQGPWSDIHGVGMFLSGNDDTLYLATHQGLFEKTNAGWGHVGNDNADLMGFSMNHETNTMYSSGHPKTGGNLGFRMSDDNGNSWKTISKVKDTPVDFHAMAVSKSNPNIILGFDSAGRGLFKTTDSGRAWESLEYPDYIMSLAISPNKLICSKL